MKRVVLCIVLALIWTVNVAAQNVPADASPAPSTPHPAASTANTPTFSDRNPRYKMRPGDEFDLTFELTPEFNQTVTVQPDGYVTLREAGDIFVNGSTIPEVTDHVRTAYAKVLSNPRISILMKTFEKPYFIADGQFDHPGKYDLQGDTTVTQAVAIAGGFTKDAHHSQVVLFHRVNESWVEAHLINVKRMESKRDLSEDMFLKPGDMIFVPKNRISKIQQWIPSSGVNVIPTTF